MLVLTCMLLYLLKVLQQTGQENCVGPMRIWEGVGIQYCPLLSLFDKNPEEESSIPLLLQSPPSPPCCCSLSVAQAEDSTEAISAALGLGNPMCSATVTLSSPPPSSCSSSLGLWRVLLRFSSTSMAVQT